ncbi:nuclear transport factor 2 family protein [Aliikangiella marina]|uniref:Nuclear transport factor 2 family protein n=1 Tax=Aliikangiella marina TaxID=1712262 RepID=A0A545T8Q7_9GAMM|nr:nuclear transport factor 2 family protein [Aliikangiella marina]TQV73591.1 nuclear transport factor 2 family protein [Aliikangiella marina]
MILDKFKKLYHDLDSSNIDIIESVYAADIEFTDPFHRVDGLQALKEYFQGMYSNVKAISFEFGESIAEGNTYFIHWVMKLSHPKLNGGKEITVPGATYLKVNESQQVIFHRDYFDAGVMLYEQLPVLGGLVKLIKRRL